VTLGQFDSKSQLQSYSVLDIVWLFLEHLVNMRFVNTDVVIGYACSPLVV